MAHYLPYIYDFINEQHIGLIGRAMNENIQLAVIYSGPSLSRLRLFQITAYLEEKI